MKTFLSLLSALLLLVPLCACAAQTDPNAGRYLCVRALYADGEDRPDGAYLTLSGEHRASLCLDGGEEAVAKVCDYLQKAGEIVVEEVKNDV